MTMGEIMTLEDGWKSMEQGIAKLKRILEQKKRKKSQFTSEEYMNLYTTIYNLCTQRPGNNYSEQLYEKYKEAYDEYLASTVLPSLEEKHDEFLLREFVYRWGNHKVMVRWLSRFFHYLDRFYTFHKQLLNLNDLGLTRFRALVYEQLKGRLRAAVFALIDQEREGGQIDRALLKNVLHVFVEMGLGELDYYEKDFEAYMLEETTAYYSRKATIWIVEDSCPQYMIKVEECLRREKDRVSHYLHSSSEAKLLNKAEHELLVVYGNQLLEKEHSGFHVLLKDDKVDDISRMYRLFSRVSDGLDIVVPVFRQHITDEGMVLVQQAEEEAKSKAETVGGSQEQGFIGNVVELHDKYMKYVIASFANSAPFHKGLKEACEVFCNKVIGGSPSAELLASYCDNVLKKGGGKALSDEGIEEALDKALKLFDYINDKDLFAEFYRKKLSRRLLFDRSGNEDHEKLALTKLKQTNGGQFTSKMEGMITDMTLAKDNQTDFQNYLNSSTNATAGVDLGVMVLTTGFWPSYKSSDLSLPAELAKCVLAFKEFYLNKTQKRKLSFIYSLGTCHVNAKFKARTYELVLGTYQAAALLLFNDSERLAYSEIKTQLNLADEDVVRVLQSLTCLKYKILKKEPNSKSVSVNDVFEFNSQFTDRMRRIRIPLPSVDERKKVAEDVNKDRRYAIDAAVVRIMKSRKVLSHQQLVQECVEQLSRMFKPDIKAIKKRIEDLISREYLERDRENPTLYKYLA